MWLRRFVCAALAFLAAAWVLLRVISLSAASIFNYAMERQQMLAGTVTVGHIWAHMDGHVKFEDLEWTGPDGQRILRIPDGSFRVRLWDVVTRNMKSTTIQELTINDANVSLRLDERMGIDIVHNSPALKEAAHEPPKARVRESAEEMKRRGQARRRESSGRIETQWKNFNREDRKIKLALELNRCAVEVFYKGRHYVVSGVSIKSDIDTDRRVTINARTGYFGGDAVGRGMVIRGHVDTSPDIPEYSFAVLLQDVDPSSLGMGKDLHDAMTLQVDLHGPITDIVGSGSVKMDELHLPGLDFDDVAGNISYRDGQFLFTEVSASVYGGRFTASGDYDLDTRYYHIDGVGEGLKAGKALPGSHLSCDVRLDLHLGSRGSAQETYVRGEFESGPGSYQHWIPFDRLRGKFTSAYRDLEFYDVSIDMAGYQVQTDAFSIVDKKLHLNPIQLTDPQGRPILYYDPDTKQITRIGAISVGG